MLSIKQGGIKYHFFSFWFDSTWDWTPVVPYNLKHNLKQMFDTFYVPNRFVGKNLTAFQLVYGYIMPRDWKIMFIDAYIYIYMLCLKIFFCTVYNWIRIMFKQYDILMGPYQALLGQSWSGINGTLYRPPELKPQHQMHFTFVTEDSHYCIF